MKIKYSALVSGARNKLNGSVASRNRYGDYFRNKTTPVNAQTTYQLLQRSQFAGNSSAWKGLTQAQRKAWNTASPNFPVTDVFGDRLELSGNALYLRLNQNLTNAGAPNIAFPPTPVAVSTAPFTFSGSVAPTGPVSVSLAEAPKENEKVFAYGVANVSVGKQYVKNLYKFLGSFGATTGSIDLGTALGIRFGTRAAGSNVWVKLVVVNTLTGQVGLPQEESITVVETTP